MVDQIKKYYKVNILILIRCLKGINKWSIIENKLQISLRFNKKTDSEIAKA